MRLWRTAAVLVMAAALAAGCTTDPKKATRNVDDAIATALGIPVADLPGVGVRSDPGSLPVSCLDACPSASVELPVRGGDHPEWLPAAVLDRLLDHGYTVVRADEPVRPAPGPSGAARPSAAAGVSPSDADLTAKCRRVLPAGGACVLRKRVTLDLRVYGDTFGLRADGA